MMSIACKEGVKISVSAMENIVIGANQDIRQVLIFIKNNIPQLYVVRSDLMFETSARVSIYSILKLLKTINYTTNDFSDVVLTLELLCSSVLCIYQE